MEPFKVHILGCGSALPTLQHSASAQIIEMRGKCFMMDCGEGAQMQFRRTHVHFAKINAIFISHLHGDHCFGLLGLLSTLGMLGRTAKLKVYAPESYGDLFKRQIDFFMQGMEYEIEFVPVDTEKSQVVYEDHSVTVETVPLQQNRDRIGSPVFNILVPVVLEFLYPMHRLVLIGKSQKVVRDAEKHDAVDNFQGVRKHDIPVRNAIVVGFLLPTVYPEILWMLLAVSERLIHDVA